MTESTGIIETIAGTGDEGYSGDNGPATSATFAYPSSVAVDSSGKRTNQSSYIVSVTNYYYLYSLGNVYIVDRGNNLVRMLTVSTGILTTVAGKGSDDYSGNGGQATDAELGASYYYVAGTGNSADDDGDQATAAELDGADYIALDSSGG